MPVYVLVDNNTWSGFRSPGLYVGGDCNNHVVSGPNVYQANNIPGRDDFVNFNRLEDALLAKISPGIVLMLYTMFDKGHVLETAAEALKWDYQSWAGGELFLLNGAVTITTNEPKAPNKIQHLFRLT